MPEHMRTQDAGHAMQYSQTENTVDDWIANIDLSNWYRYYYIIKAVLRDKPQRVLEIGVGNGVVKSIITKQVKEYKVLDINANLSPDYVGDMRERKEELMGGFDAIICADVLEHMPFIDLKKNLENIRSYLTNGGRAYITIPHRRGRVLLVSPFSYHKAILLDLPVWLKSSMKSFWEQYVQKKTWIDIHHCWEIDDRNHHIKDVDAALHTSGLNIVTFQKLLQVDFWILSKPSSA